MLNEMKIPIEDLLLDPNNPRFTCGFNQQPIILDAAIEAEQEKLLKRFSKNPVLKDSDFDVTNIKDLYDSMLRIGFVNIDRIVVRATCGESKKYLVLEGNRRIAAVKSLLKDYDSNCSPLAHPENRKDFEPHLLTFKTITAMVLDIEGLSAEEVKDRIAIILGIRHHGSLLEWEPLPKAFNIFTEYMDEPPMQHTFQFDNKKVKAVANRLCIETQKVVKALRTYQAYLQIKEVFPEVKDDHFSLIESGVQDRHLSGNYFKIDTGTYKLDEPSLGKINSICQFATRDSNNPEFTINKKKKILPRPHDFRLLGKLIDKMQCATHPAVKEYANVLIHRVEDEEDFEMTLDQAIDDLTVFEKQTKWVEAIEKMLNKQEKELAIDKYLGDGLDRGRKDELKMTLEPLRKIMNV